MVSFLLSALYLLCLAPDRNRVLNPWKKPVVVGGVMIRVMPARCALCRWMPPNLRPNLLVRGLAKSSPWEAPSVVDGS